MTTTTNKKQYTPQTYLCIPDKVYKDISSSKVNSKIISLYFTIKLLVEENPTELKYLSVYLKEDLDVLSDALLEMQKLNWIEIDNEAETVSLV